MPAAESLDLTHMKVCSSSLTSRLLASAVGQLYFMRKGDFGLGSKYKLKGQTLPGCCMNDEVPRVLICACLHVTCLSFLAERLVVPPKYGDDSGAKTHESVSIVMHTQLWDGTAYSYESDPEVVVERFVYDEIKDIEPIRESLANNLITLTSSHTPHRLTLLVPPPV